MRARRRSTRALPFALPLALLLALLLALALAPALVRAAAGPIAASGAAPMRVVYLAGASVYVDAGASDGLRAGDTLIVSRVANEVARLRVSVLSTHRAACDTLLTLDALKIGDAVRRTRAASFVALAPDSAGTDSSSAVSGPAASTSTNAATAPARASARTARNRPWTRGRVGARWLSVAGSSGTRYQQPMLDVRLDGGTDDAPVSASLDMRGRQTTRVASGGETASDAEARVYRASLTLRERDGRTGLSLGRISSPSLASVSLFDGALVETGGSRWKAGMFGGTQPDPLHMGWSNDIAEYGAYLETHQRPLDPKRWTMELGAVSSYDHGQRNRDFLFGQAYWRDRRFSGSLLQEADMLRGWRRQPGDPGLSLTSTFATAQAQIAPWFSLQSGYDNRHNIRLWRDRLTPETEFDDRYRQGAWAGANLRFPAGFGLSGDQRWNRGAGENATVTSASAELFHPSWRALSLHGRWSDYRATLDRSRLLSLSLGASPTFGWHLEMSGGQRRTGITGTGADENIRWWGVDTDLAVGRRWFLDASFETERGDLERTTQFYAGVSRRL